MTVYDNQGEQHNANHHEDQGAAHEHSRTAHSQHAERDLRAGYRPGWVWIPLAVLFLLIVLVMGTGFIYGGYNDRMRGYDNGTALEQSRGEMTQPGLPTPFPNANAPETGIQGTGQADSSIPEAAPALANDGQ